MAKDFVALDVETTDIQGYICSIGLVKFIDSVQVDSYYSLVNPLVEIAPGATETHGITDNDVADQPIFKVIYPEIRAFIGDLPVVAHNASSDMGALIRTQDHQNIPFDGIKYMCTLNTARRVYPFTKTQYKSNILYSTIFGHSLAALAHEFDVEQKEQHNALDDARVAGEILVKLMTATGYDDLEEYVNACGWKGFGVVGESTFTKPGKCKIDYRTVDWLMTRRDRAVKWLTSFQIKFEEKAAQHSVVAERLKKQLREEEENGADTRWIDGELAYYEAFAERFALMAEKIANYLPKLADNDPNEPSANAVQYTICKLASDNLNYPFEAKATNDDL